MKNAVSNLNEQTRVDICLVKKTSSKTDTKKYELGTVELVDEVPKAFRHIITKKLNGVLQQIEDQTVEFRNFFDINIKRDNISELQNSEIAVFKHIRDKMKRFTTIPPIKNLKEIKHFESYALEFHLPNNKIVYFTKIPRSQFITRKFGLTVALNRGKFNKVKGDVFGFDDNIDCIYFEETDSLLILDKIGTEQIFNFKLFYQQKTEQAFGKLVSSKLVVIKNTLFDEIKENTRYTRKITTLLSTGKFDRKIEWFQEHLDYFIKQGLSKESTLLEINGQKIIIDNKEKLTMFLDICNHEYQEEVIDKIPYHVTGEKDQLKI